MRVYLDSCCYNRPYDDQSQLKVNLETLAKLEIQHQIRSGKLELAASYILVSENAVNPFEQKRTDIQSFVDTYTYIFVSRNQEATVKRIAASITKTGIKLMDACHIASAIIADCDIFFTTDKRLLKYKTNSIRMMNPAEFILEMGNET